MNKKILVTGSMGFIGKAWCELLLKNDFKVIGIDIKKNSIKHKNFSFYKETIFNYNLIKKLIKKSDIICHYAGIAEPDLYLSRTNRVIDITILPLIDIANLCAKYNKKLVYTSTSEIYGKSIKTPFKEDGERLYGSTFKSRWCYATAKSLSEHYIYGLKQSQNLDFIVFRLFNVYGPNLKGRVVDKFIENALSNKDLIINGNGSQIRCYTYIDDCIDAFYQSIFNYKLTNKTLNIGSDIPVTVKKLAYHVIKLTNSKSSIKKFDKKNKDKGYEDIQIRIPDISEIKKLIKWKATTSIEQGLNKMIKSYEKI